jgi:hypothetical protein
MRRSVIPPGGLKKTIQSIENPVSYKGCVSMTQTLEAVFEDGKLRLLEKPAVPLHDGQRVRLTVETESAPDDVLALAEPVYAGLSDEEVDDVERIALDRHRRRTWAGDQQRAHRGLEQ